MMKAQKDKLLKEGENKSNETEKKTAFRRYCPIIDQVVEADTQEEWELKVKEIMKSQGK